MLCYTFITYFASYLALRYVIFEFLRNEYMDSEFYLRLVGLRPTMMPVGGGHLQGSLEVHVPPP